MYLNKVMLYGNLTRDPELRSLPSGIQVANFSIATNRVYKDKDGNKQEQADFHNIVVFGRQAETSAQYLKKGSATYVEGRMQTRSWEQDGQKKYRTEVIAERVQFGPRSAGSSSSVQDNDVGKEENRSNQSDSGSGIDYPQDEINPDDIPF
jgi:single-strand DNA-binding protein